MNELVQRLKLQAGINDNPDQEGLDLFAELIVQECMSKTAGYLLEDEFGGPDVKEASEELAKYFGVEQ